jgi:hypothetical protein
MHRHFLLLSLVCAAACDYGGGTAASGVYPNYFLSSVDGKALPVPSGSDGSELLAGSLDFGGLTRARGSGPVGGVVSYRLSVRHPDHSITSSNVQLNYSIGNDTLRINLCPSLAQCIVSEELVGPLTDSHSELVLTHYLAGNPGTVYRYFPALPD